MIAGLTGGIGSGKSMVARLLGLLGCAVFNSDNTASGIYDDASVKEKVIALLGAESYTLGGSLNKNYVSKRIFENAELRRELNGIIHPEVGKCFREFAERNKHKIVVKETALLFEAGIDKEVDKVIVVTAPLELRIQRVISRDSLTREDVIRKIESQMPEKDKVSRAHFVIHNDEQQFLIPQVLGIFQSLQGV